MSRLYIGRSREVDSEEFTGLFDIIVSTRQPNYIRMEFYISIHIQRNSMARESYLQDTF